MHMSKTRRITVKGVRTQDLATQDIAFIFYQMGKAELRRKREIKEREKAKRRERAS